MQSVAQTLSVEAGSMYWYATKSSPVQLFVWKTACLCVVWSLLKSLCVHLMSVLTLCVCLSVCVCMCACAGLHEGEGLIHHPSWLCSQAQKAALWMWHCSPSNIKYSTHIFHIPFPNNTSLYQVYPSVSRMPVRSEVIMTVQYHIDTKVRHKVQS